MQSVLRKVQPEDALKISDTVMSALLQLLITQSGQGGGTKEDALLAVAILVEGCCYFVGFISTDATFCLLAILPHTRSS